MNRKELLEKIKKEIPNNLNEKETAAYIMKEIARDRAFSEHYYWGNSKIRKKIYKESVDLEKVEPQNRRKLICVTSSRLFHYIATELGLDVYYLGEDGTASKRVLNFLKTEEHLCTVIRLKTGEFIKCDVQKELENIQTGCRWKSFGGRDRNEISFLSQLPKDEVEEIMKKIGYLENRENYTDDYCNEDKKKIGYGYTTTDIVKKVFYDNRLSEEIKNTSVRETYKFLAKIFKIYLDDYRKGPMIPISPALTQFGEKFFMFPCAMKSKEKARYTICVYTYENEEIGTIFLLNRSNMKMEEISIDELRCYEELGLKLGIVKNGTKYLKRKMHNRREETINPKIQLEEIIKDDEEADLS